MVDITNKGRIDTHVHVVLDQFLAGLKSAGGDPSGWVAPSWSPEEAIKQMDAIGVKKQILSITSPGPSVVGANQAGRDLTRGCNEETAAICKKHPERFSFFASTPSFVDVDGTIAEIEHSLTNLGAVGVVVMTSYDNKLLGDKDFQPIWDVLEKHKAIVFIHPGAVDITPKHIGGILPQPTIDYPLATTRTAVDLVVTRTFSNHPNVKVILSHAGGTLPFLGDRVVKSMDIEQVQKVTGMSGEEVMRDFQRFYYDTAVSTSKPQLLALLAFAKPENVLFGSDFPYAPFDFGYKTTVQFDEFVESEEQGKLLAGVNSANANKLFGWSD